MGLYTTLIAAKLTPDQKDRIEQRAGECGMKPGEYARKILLESVEISPGEMRLMMEFSRLDNFIGSLIAEWLRETPISKELIAQLRSDSERRKLRLAEAAISRARGAVNE